MKRTNLTIVMTACSLLLIGLLVPLLERAFAAVCDDKCLPTNVWGRVNSVDEYCYRWYVYDAFEDMEEAVNTCEILGYSTGGDASKTCQGFGAAPVSTKLYKNCTDDCTLPGGADPTWWVQRTPGVAITGGLGTGTPHKCLTPPGS